MLEEVPMTLDWKIKVTLDLKRLRKEHQRLSKAVQEEKKN
jgi:hypothetical protein